MERDGASDPDHLSVPARLGDLIRERLERLPEPTRQVLVLALPDEDSDEFKSLARRLGYRERDWKGGAEKLAADIRRRMKEVNSYYVSRFNPPAGVESSL